MLQPGVYWSIFLDYSPKILLNIFFLFLGDFFVNDGIDWQWPSSIKPEYQEDKRVE